MRILVVDDEKVIVKGIKFNLENEGYQVECAYDGTQALDIVRNVHIDLIILDLMMPEMDGLETCRRIREFSNVPVIMLTAKGEDMDKIIGFEYGADDYMTKPFNILELKSRVRAILRRSTGLNEKVQSNMNCGDVVIDSIQHAAFLDGQDINLTAKEFDLVELLVKNPGRVYTRESLLNIVWGYEYPGDARTVDVHIRRLREKIEEDPANPEHIMTKWGVGYYFKA